MRCFFNAAIAAALAVLAGAPQVRAANVVTVTCVIGTTGSGCLNQETGTSNGYAVVAQGYTVPGDGGGGQFADIGGCDTGTYTATGNTQGDTVINYNHTGPKPTVGSAVTESTGTVFQPGTVVTKASATLTFTINLPIQANLANNTLLTFQGNGGTLILSSVSPKDCFEKTDYRGDPHEWGGVGDGQTNDTLALQRWLAYPNGPWMASIPANYQTNQPLTCWAFINVQAPANNPHEDVISPLVEITIGSSFPSATASSHTAVMAAKHQCRISGLSIDALSPNATSCHTSNPLAFNCYIDAMNIAEGGVVIDGHASLNHGYYNLNCPNLGTGNSGAQLKDAQFNESFSDNIEINCANVRIVGDIISLTGSVNGVTQMAGAVGINAAGEDLTISNGNIEQSLGRGIYLNGAAQVSVTGMFIEKNGNASGGAGIEIDGGHTISVCGNHLKQNDSNSASTYSAQIRFGQFGSGNSSDVSFCGNVYKDNNDGISADTPNYVYDVNPGTSVSNITLYENPQNQATGVFSPNAGTQHLQHQQALPCTAGGYTCSP